MLIAAASPIAASADPDSTSAPSAATSTVLVGTVRSGTGLPVAGAAVRLSGPTSTSAVTDAAGTFTVTVPQGIYTISVSRTGYNPAVLSNVVAVGGTSQPVAVTLNAQDLSSLRTIGGVSATSRGSGSAINTGAASSSFVPAQAFANVANPQINDVLQRVPDITLQHMGSQPDVSIVLGGVQPYETQVLIDGHPLALGQFGVWTSQYFPSYLIGGVETQSGPGNTTPFANIAVGGTVNLLTPGFTTRPTAEIIDGVDNYASQYSNFLATGSVGKLQYVAGAGVSGINGPYYQTKQCVVSPDNGGANDNQPGNKGVVQYCGDASGSFFSKGELGKLRYNFSPSTSFDVGFTGAWGGYEPQGTAWGTYLGATTIEPCLTSNPSQCNNPHDNYLIGQTINAYAWYTGSSVYNNQWLYDAQLRTSLGNNTILVRPYIGDIEPEVITGGDTQASYPNFFSPVGAANNPAELKAFQTACTNNFDNLTNPAGQTVITNGQIECFNSAYQTYEQDKLYGTTFSFLHPFGNNLVGLNYDFHGQSTFAYINSPADVSVPFSTDRYSTFSLTGQFAIARNVGLDTGLYDTRWTASGVQPLIGANGQPVVVDNNTVLTGLGRAVSRFDPHVALTFRPTGDVSYRAASGSSATFPFVGQVSGLATYEEPAGSLGPIYALGGTLTEKNPNLAPEVSTSYNVGVDKRFGSASVLSVDLTNTIIHNVFEQLTTNVPLNGGTEGIFSPVNVARLHAELATLRYNYAPRVGVGANIAVAANRSILQGLPPGFTGPPTNGVQICGNGVAAPGIATCIPYLKAYGQATYVAHGGTFLALGVEYEGKNNSYFQPPFALVDFTFRRPVTHDVEVQVGAENLLNTNVYSNASYLATPNAGTPIVAGQLNGTLGSFTPTLVSAPARTVRVQIRLHTGR
jgi:outer membrane receptor protein involved in Fe transport